jgi:hypothetical protein
MSDNVETTTKSKRAPKEPKAEKPKKEKKVKVDKYNGFKVPAKSGPRTTKCVNHIYDMIKEAAPTLLERDDVRTAFNNYVDCLRKYDGAIESWTPSAKYKYSSGIKIDENNKFSPLKGLPCRFSYTYNTGEYEMLKDKVSDSATIILNAYRPLYDLIKRDVVPYMEIKHWEIRSKKDIENYHKIIEKEERNIKTFEEAIENTRKVICEYATKALALQTPPTVTKFD